jgi:hypothetical protein
VAAGGIAAEWGGRWIEIRWWSPIGQDECLECPWEE